MNTSTIIKTIALLALPAIGQPLEGGTFAGVTTKKDGTHCAVILLPGKGEDLTWQKALAWADEQGGELPTRPVAALLFANVKDKLESEWHWTADEYSENYAWFCHFGYGFQFYDHKDFFSSAVSVRCIPLA